MAATTASRGLRGISCDTVRRLGGLFLMCLVSIMLAACGQPGDRAGGEIELPLPDFIVPGAIAALPQPQPVDPARIALGRQLFNDARLSADESVSCASCHILEQGGADPGRVHSVGVHGREGRINTPSVLNAAFNVAQFWDGRARTLEEQLALSLADPLEMDQSAAHGARKLAVDADLNAAFRGVYRDGLTAENLIDVLAYYVRALTTPDAPFDRYLRGDPSAVDEEAIEGYALFQTLGCISCHHGRNVGGNLFQRMGVMDDYFAAVGERSIADRGRYNVTGRERDRHVFKVPSLRNVAERPPYFHDGSAWTLQEAVQTMVRYQLGRPASDEDIELIVAFLRSLSGELPEIVR
jgi:cytochrome c peroxidase